MAVGSRIKRPLKRLRQKGQGPRNLGDQPNSGRCSAGGREIKFPHLSSLHHECDGYTRDDRTLRSRRALHTGPGAFSLSRDHDHARECISHIMQDGTWAPGHRRSPRNTRASPPCSTNSSPRRTAFLAANGKWGEEHIPALRDGTSPTRAASRPATARPARRNGAFPGAVRNNRDRWSPSAPTGR